MSAKIILMITVTTVTTETVTMEETESSSGFLPVKLCIAWLIDGTHISLHEVNLAKLVLSTMTKIHYNFISIISTIQLIFLKTLTNHYTNLELIMR